MVLPSFRKLGKTTRTNKTPRRRQQPAWQLPFRPVLEQLESLTLPSTVTWNGGSGDWDTAANWSTGLVPGSGDDVVINSGNPTHGLTNADAVHSITNSVPVAIAAGTLTVGSGTSAINAALTVSSGATLTLNGSTVNGSGTLTNSGTLNITSSTLAAGVVNQGTLMNFGSDTFNGSLANAAGATLWVQGNSTGGSATLTSANGFTNDGTIRLESINSSWSEALTVSSGTLTNASDGMLLVNPGTGGNRTLSGNFTNQGTVSVGAGVIFPENGTSPTFTQAGGTFSVDPTSLFYVNGGSITFSGGAISGPVFGDSSTVNVTAGVTTPSTVYMNSGTLVNNLSPVVTVWDQGNATFGHSTVVLAANATNAGTLHLESANSTYSSNLGTSSFTLTNTGTISVSLGSGGNRIITGNLANSGQVTVDSNASLLIESGTYTAAGGTITGPAVLNADTIAETASPAAPSTIVLVNAATLTTDNLANYTLWVQGDSIGGSITLTSASSFTNYGTLRLESLNAGYSETISLGSGSTLTNAPSGTLLVNPGTGGNRTLTGSLTNQGTVTVGVGVALPETGSNPVFTQAGGTFTVGAGGLFYVNNGTINFTGGALSGLVFGASSTVTVTAGVTTAATLYMNGGTLVNNLSPVVTVWNQGNATFGHSTVVLAANGTNAGTLHLESINGGYNSNLSIPSGAFTNAGVISVSLGTGGNRSISGNLINQGQINVDSTAGLTLIIQSGTYTAAGGTITGPAYVVNDTLQETASPASPSTIVLSANTTLISDNLANYTLWAQGGALGNNEALTSASGFSNYGTLRLESIGGGYYEAFTISSGVLTNAVGGTILVNAGTGGSRSLSGNLTNQGTLIVGAGTTFIVSSGTLTNDSGGTLTGGTYNISGTFQFPNAAITTNVATIVLTGASSQIVDQSANNALANFAGNAAAGSFTIQNGRNFSGSYFTNAGSLTIGASSTFALTGTLTQTGGTSTLLGGTLTSTAPPPPPGPSGDGLLFNGTSDFVSAPSSASLNPTSQVTVEAWVNFNVLNNSTMYLAGTWMDIGTHYTYELWINNGQAEFSISHTGSDFAHAAGSTTLQVGHWYHLAGTFNGTTITVYVNGVADGTTTFAGPLATNTNVFSIGLGGFSYVNGVIDEVRVWNVARTQAQVQADMSGPLTGNESGLALYYNFNEGTGTTAHDLTANHNDGSLGGGVPANQPTWVGVSPPVNIQAGSLNGTGTVNGNVSNAGQVNPGGVGAAGTLAINGTYTQTAAGALNAELGGLTAGSQFDLLAVSGAATLAGTLNLSEINSFGPAIPNSFQVLTAGSVSGTFATVNGLTVGNGVRFLPQYDPSDVTLLTRAITTIAVQSSVNASTYGQTVTFTATVTTIAPGAGTPTGTVTFTLDGNPQTPVTLDGSGQATLTLATLTAGSHSLSVAFSPTSYFLASNSSTLSQGVNPAPLTITADNQSKFYGAALPAFTATYSGFVLGEGPSVLTGTLSFSTPATVASPVGTYAITPSGQSDPNYTITFVASTLTIAPVGLTISADNQTMPYGGPLPTLTVSYNGFVNGDTAASLTTPPALSTAATAASHVGTYTITAGGAVDADYTISYVAGTLTVTPAALTISADNQTKAYGAAVPTLTASYSGFVNGDTAASLTTPPTLSTTATAASHVAGSPYPITASGAVDGDYTISYNAGALTVTPAGLTITADNQSMVYGGPLPTLTVSYSGFVNGDTAASLTTPPTVTTTATAASHVAGNPYPITASGAVDSDYTISYNAGALTITPAALTITADNQSMVYGGPLPTLTVSYSGFVNGDTAASLTTPPTVTTTATAASHVGLYAIMAAGAVDGDYAISYVAGNLTITPAALTITANDQSMVYGSSLPTFTASYSGFVNGDTPASLTTPPTLRTTATAASHVGTYPITATGAVDPDYTISYVYGTLTITPAPLTISADNQSMVYGGTLPALTVSYSGFVNGDTAASLMTAPTVSTTATAASHVGSYAITVSGAVDADYSISYSNGTLTITPAPLTISANNRTMVYGAAVPALTAAYSGFVNGDTAASLTTPPTLATPATSSSPVGTYPITASGAVDPDYAISYVAGTLTINQASSASMVSSSLNPSVVGQSVTFTATISAVAPGSGTPTGTVTFMDGSNTLGMGTLSGGMATFTTSALTVGTHSITAVYGSDGNFTGSTSAPLSQAVNPTNGVPVVTGVSPNSGSTAGGTAVTITGAGFTGVTAVMFGTVAASFTFVSDGQITATAPVHAAGLVNIQVMTPNGTSVQTAADHFTYLAPEVTGVSPNTGSTAGGTVITITGSNFVGITAVHIGGVAATSFTVVSATQITATTPAHAAGAFLDVRVTNAGATSATVAADQFTYLAPAVTGVSPSSGSTEGGDVLTITGSNFIGITAVRIGGVLATSFTVVSATQITATTPVHVGGIVNVHVTNAGATSATTTADRFTYLAPAITNVSPNVGPTLGGTVVTITGTDFVGITAVNFGTTPAASFTVVSATQITATAPAHALGTVSITVTNAGATSVSTTADHFTYQGPIISGVSPNSGTTAGGTVVTITGSNFLAVTAVDFGSTAATSFTVMSSTQITATAPVHAGGLVNVRVTSASITSAVVAADQFTYLAPAVSGVSPNTGSTAGGTVVTITGSNFIGITEVRFGATVATSFTVVSATQITATAPAHAGGNVDVRVLNAGAASAVVTADQFTYQAPAILGISPNSGLSTGGTVVTITGSNFVGITAVKFGGTAATSFTVMSATQITATAPAHAAGTVDVRVVNAGATSAVTAGDQFTYLTGVGPSNSGGRSDPARAELASGLEEVPGEMWTRESRAAASADASRSARSTTTGMHPSVDARAVTLARADVEDFFSAAPAPSTVEWGTWVADLVPTDGRPAADVLAALVSVAAQE